MLFLATIKSSQFSKYLGSNLASNIGVKIGQAMFCGYLGGEDKSQVLLSPRVENLFNND
jgi:hypothetical protein